jgi:MATE family multidrug resistance protein
VVAQRIGAGDPLDAQRVGVHGLQIGLLLAAVVGGCIYLTREAVVRLYTHDAVIIAAALPLLSWVVLFHIGDAAQTLASFILRAYRIAAVPVLIYAVSLWGVGLGGGYVIAFNVIGSTPAGLLGARGFWFASTVSLAIAGIGLGSFLAWVWRQKRREA